MQLEALTVSMVVLESALKDGCFYSLSFYGSLILLHIFRVLVFNFPTRGSLDDFKILKSNLDSLTFGIYGRSFLGPFS